MARAIEAQTGREAVALAKEIGAAEADDGQHHRHVADALAVMSRDMGTFCGVSLLTFEGGGVAGYDLVVDEDGNPCD